jgi:4-nitrophenyl phosphatase
MDWMQYDYFLIDLDGTIYRGTELIPHADTFIEQLKERDKHYLFVTNNSTRTPDQIAAQLQQYGLLVDAHEVFTSAQAAAAFLKPDNPAAKVMLIGEEGLHRAMEDEGLAIVDEHPTHVVVGLDRQFSYNKLAVASKAIRNGAKFIATNTDRVLVTEQGLTPGGGSIVAAVAAASGKEPLVIGKPESHIVDLALQRIGAVKEKSVMIGDNLETDIAAGVRAGVDSILVTTGVSTAEEGRRSKFPPIAIWESLAVGKK